MSERRNSKQQQQLILVVLGVLLCVVQVVHGSDQKDGVQHTLQACNAIDVDNDYDVVLSSTNRMRVERKL